MPDLHLTENFGDLLDSRFRKIFTTEYAENIKESMIPMLFNVTPTTKNYEMLSGIGGGADVGLFDGSLDYDTVTQLYDKTTYFLERAQGMKVQRKLYDDDLQNIMNRRPWQCAINVARTREKQAADIFNNAFVGTGGGDGVALCSASHPYSPTDATTQSNTGVLTLNAVNIEATRRIGNREIFNDRGELFDVNYDTILCTSLKEEAAWEIINSKGKVDTDINNRNFHYGRYKLAVWDRLSASYAWYMMDSVLMKMFLIWWTRIGVEYNYDRDHDTFQSKWSTYYREHPDFYDWRWVYGHNATS
jgi:hypothetical protein